MTEHEPTPIDDAAEAFEAGADGVVEEARDDEAQAPQWAPEVEEEARLFGWKPRDEWVGDVPPTFKDDPSEFLDRVQKSKTFQAVRAQSEEKLRRIEATLEAARARDMERQRSEYERRIAEIESQQRAAAETADVQAFDRASQARRQLEQQWSQPQAQPGPDPNAPAPIDDLPPEVREYAATDDGKWIADPALQVAGRQIIDQTPGAMYLSPMEQIELARERLKSLYPHRFKDEAPARPQSRPRVDGGGIGAPRSKSGFDALPRDARDEFKRQVQRGVFTDTKEDREFFHDAYVNG